MMFRNKKTEFKSWHAILLIGILLTATILGILQRVTERDANESQNPSVQEKPILNANTCNVTGGSWNECGSACRTEPDAVCIDVCVQYCECVTDNQCPFGYSCSDFVDGVGVCL